MDFTLFHWFAFVFILYYYPDSYEDKLCLSVYLYIGYSYFFLHRLLKGRAAVKGERSGDKEPATRVAGTSYLMHRCNLLLATKQVF